MPIFLILTLPFFSMLADIQHLENSLYSEPEGAFLNVD